MSLSCVPSPEICGIVNRAPNPWATHPPRSRANLIPALKSFMSRGPGPDSRRDVSKLSGPLLDGCEVPRPFAIDDVERQPAGRRTEKLPLLRERESSHLRVSFTLAQAEIAYGVDDSCIVFTLSRVTEIAPHPAFELAGDVAVWKIEKQIVLQGGRPRVLMSKTRNSM